MWRPHCWQYAKPTGVGVPHRGHEIMLPCAATTRGAEPPLADGGTNPGPGAGSPDGVPIMPGGGPAGFVGGGGSDAGGGAIAGEAIAVAAIGFGDIAGAPNAGGGAIPGAPYAGIGGAMPGAPYAGGAIGGGAIMGGPAGAAPSAPPQLRQNFIPGGFSPRQAPQIVGNPPTGAGVWAKASGADAVGASELPQLRQNDEPAGLSWPHIEQRIGPLTLNPHRVSQ